MAPAVLFRFAYDVWEVQMEIFLSVLSLSLVGVLVSAVLFAAASRDARRVEAALTPASIPDEERFFVMRPAARPAWHGARVPADVLAMQIERHVRLEQAVAEGFRQFPSVEALHSPTLSPLAG